LLMGTNPDINEKAWEEVKRGSPSRSTQKAVAPKGESSAPLGAALGVIAVFALAAALVLLLGA